MKVLLIEDDDFKAGKIRRVVEIERVVSSLSLARSVSSGIAALNADIPDLLLLDMSLTTYDLGPDEGGWRPRNFGGIEIFEELDRLEIELPVVVVTGFETFQRDSRPITISELRKDLRERFPGNFCAIIYFDVEGSWKARLQGLLKKYGRRK